jgi:hypothetical protein
MKRTVAGLALAVVLLAAPATRTEADGPCGAFNADGVVNAVDAAIILQVVADLYDPGVFLLNKVDLDQDVMLTSIDAQLVLQYDAGLLDQLTC